MKKSAKSTTKLTESQVVETGKVVRQTNSLYLSIKAIGMVDAKGKSIFSIGYSGKIAPPPDRGLGIIVMLMEELSKYLRYSSPEAAKHDLQLLKDYINDLEVTEPTKEDPCKKS